MQRTGEILSQHLQEKQKLGRISERVKRMANKDGTGPRSGSAGPKDGRGKGKGRADGEGTGKKKGGKKGNC